MYRHCSLLTNSYSDTSINYLNRYMILIMLIRLYERLASSDRERKRHFSNRIVVQEHFVVACSSSFTPAITFATPSHFPSVVPAKKKEATNLASRWYASGEGWPSPLMIISEAVESSMTSETFKTVNPSCLNR